MDDHKKLRRDIKAVWNEIRRERRAASKITEASDLTAAADRLSEHVAALRNLAGRMSHQADAAPPSKPKDKVKRTPKTKPKAKRKPKPKKNAPE